ncbi:MAG: hypothetical protein GXP25_11240 [Planctomycetes bacterium]|nr:hypothetical protein [Planctomycetota bacterium]
MTDIFSGNEKFTKPMSVRERFNRVMHYQKVDRIPFFEFGYWTETLPTWHEQGLPKEIDNEAKAYEYFGIENRGGVPVNVQIFPGPVYEAEVIEETDEYITKREADGRITRINKTGHKSIPQHIDFSLKNRKDWEKYKKHLDPHTEGRIAPAFYENLDHYRNADYPIAAPIGSMIGVPRNWIGFEHIGLLAYDDPDLLDEIVETLCQVVEVQLKEVCQYVDFDMGAGWEDICFNSGPIISPKMYDQFVVPRYKRITDILRKHGCDVIFTDCDGNITPIIDCFLAGGINCMFPCEVNGGSDPVEIREKWGTQVLIIGGVCKMRLAEGPKVIEEELKRLEPVVREGGFIPHVDHRVPPSVSLENYKFYLKTKRAMFKAGHREPQYDEKVI